MTSIKARLQQVGSFNKLPKRDQQVLRNEFTQICLSPAAPSSFCAPLKQYAERVAKATKQYEDYDDDTSEAREPNYETKLAALKQKMTLTMTTEWARVNVDSVMTIYWRDLYSKRSTVALANRMDQGFSWNEMNDQQFGALKSAIKKRNAITEDNDAIEKE